MINGVRRHALLLVVAVGLALRVYPWLLPNAFLGVLEHDDGIYYGGAKLLLHGQLPYADVALVHPPGASFLLLPFAALGDLTSDPVGLAAARVAMALVAVANILLVHRLAARLPAAPGRAPAVALAAAAVYAVIPNAVIAEHTVLLEPLVTLPCLLAVLLLTSRTGHRAVLLAGLLLALAVSIKLFAGAYVLVLIAWLLVRRQHRALLWLTGGLAAGTALFLLPFAVADPRAFWQDIVITQLSRPMGRGRWHRLADMVGLGELPAVLSALLLGVLVMHVSRHARREPGSPYWLWVGVLVVGGASFVSASSYFPHYGAFLAPAVAVLVTRGLAREVVSRGSQVVLGVLLLAFFAGSVIDNAKARGQADWQALARHVPEDSCVFYESASVPLALDRLAVPSEDCPAWLDARGLLYSWSGDWPRDRDFYYEGFTTNRRWQQGVQNQLRHADRLLLKAAPQVIPEWAPDTKAYVVANFQRVASVEGKDKANVEVWARR